MNKHHTYRSRGRTYCMDSGTVPHPSDVRGELRKGVQYAEGIVLNNHRALDGATSAERSKLAADIEVTMVELATELRR